MDKVQKLSNREHEAPPPMKFSPSWVKYYPIILFLKNLTYGERPSFTPIQYKSEMSHLTI
jgi:hypothetical protein